jgi:tRNA(Ile)-lysidine synthase
VDVAAKSRRERANLEDAARRARQDFFSRLVEQGEVDRIAVAHTADDQAETVLAHILRGTGLAGLGGIHPSTPNIIRPLLHVRRAELRSYLRSRKQTWREDATNRDIAKMRARIRKRLLPLLEKQFQPAVVEHLSTLANLARGDEALLEKLTSERYRAIVKISPTGATLAINDLLGSDHGQSDYAFSKRLIRKIVDEQKSRDGQLTSRHVESVLALAKQGENGKKVLLPGGLEVRREKSSLSFVAAPSRAIENCSNAEQGKKFEYKVELKSPNTILSVPLLGCAFRFTAIDWPLKSGETTITGSILDRDALHFPLTLRNWRSGDRVRPRGHRAAHKLKRLLNEKRINRWQREGWPVLTSGDVVVWARGFEVAEDFAATERTRSGIVIAEENL